MSDWKTAQNCPRWESCSISVCPLDTEAGIRLDGEPECGRVDQSTGSFRGLDAKERWELVSKLGLDHPRHGLTEIEWKFVQEGDPIWIRGWQKWLPNPAEITAI